MISVWYDSNIDGIWVSFRDDPFLARSLSASADGDVVTIRITGSTGDPVSVAPFTGFARQDGATGFASADEAVAYLQGEFEKRRALGVTYASEAAAVWTIQHDLGFCPNVLVIDSAGDPGFADVRYPDLSTVVLTFSVPTSGTAYLS